MENKEQTKKSHQEESSMNFTNTPRRWTVRYGNAIEKRRLKIYPLEKDTKRYVCNACGVTFSRKWSRARHILGKHRSNIGFKCDLCDVILCREDILRRHKKNVHSKYKWSNRNPYGKTHSQNKHPNRPVLTAQNETFQSERKTCKFVFGSKEKEKKHTGEPHTPEKNEEATLR